MREKENSPYRARDEPVAEFKTQTASRRDVYLDRAASPRTSVDADSHWRNILAVEPSPGCQPASALFRPHRINGITCLDNQPISHAQIRLVHLLETIDLADQV